MLILYKYIKKKGSILPCLFYSYRKGRAAYLSHASTAVGSSIISNSCRESRVFSYVDLQVFVRTCENFMDHF